MHLKKKRENFSSKGLGLLFALHLYSLHYKSIIILLLKVIYDYEN